MKEKSFEKLVWELVKDGRNTTLVVDNFHGYSMIQNRVDYLLEQVRMPDDEDGESQQMILQELVALGACIQLVTENLRMTPEQLERDESIDILEEEAEQGREVGRRFVDMLDREKKVIRSLQKGVTRFSVEFDAATLEGWKSQVED